MSLIFCCFCFRLWRQKARGVDCGDEVAEWLTKVLFDNQKEVRLIYRGNFPWERNANKPKYFEFPQFKKEDKVTGGNACKFIYNI